MKAVLDLFKDPQQEKAPTRNAGNGKYFSFGSCLKIACILLFKMEQCTMGLLPTSTLLKGRGLLISRSVVFFFFLWLVGDVVCIHLFALASDQISDCYTHIPAYQEQLTPLCSQRASNPIVLCSIVFINKSLNVFKSK